MADFVDKSLCKDCVFRVSRSVSTEGLHLVDDEGNAISDDITEICSEICSKLSMDLDHIVLKCSAYKSKYNASDHFFINKSIFNLTKIE